MAEEKTYVFDGGSRNDIPLAYALNGGFGNGFGNGFGGYGGFGGGILGFLIGILFGGAWGGNGFGGFGGGSGLSGQLNSDANTSLVMQAINGTDADVRTLATTINADFNDVRDAVCDLRASIQSVGAQVGMSGLQVQNAILSGDASIVAKLQECCCENRLLTTQQGYENRIAISDQTNTLSTQGMLNTRSITDAIAAQTTMITKEFCELKEREYQNKIESLAAANATLRNQIDNSTQTAAFAAMLAPIQKEVSDIRAAQPQTVSVPWPQLTAVNTSPSIYGLGLGYGLGWGYGSNNGSIWA